jgi:hypothetical protein
MPTAEWSEQARLIFPRFERRLFRRNDSGGRFGRGAEPPSEEKHYKRRKRWLS